MLVNENDDKTVILKVCDFVYLNESNSTLTRKKNDFYIMVEERI